MYMHVLSTPIHFINTLSGNYMHEFSCKQEHIRTATIHSPVKLLNHTRNRTPRRTGTLGRNCELGTGGKTPSTKWYV